MNYSEALEKIDSLLVFGSRPGLERVRELLHLMGDPQNELRFIHVAGTNGKGSVCHMLASVLTAGGYKTGLFTSPHITGFGERMRIDGEFISESDVVSLVERYFPFVEKLREENKIITEFEFVTAIAFAYFKESGCDVVVLETGMGGRFDATNVIEKPLCSVITPLSLDHTAVLGDTLDKIAFEKAGIIKNESCVVYALQEQTANEVIMKTAKERGCTVHIPAGNVDVVSCDYRGSVVRIDGDEVLLRLAGKHQISNLKLVLAAIEALRVEGITITNECVKEGLRRVFVPARFEVLSESPLVIADGAHNPGGMNALSAAVDELLGGYDIVCVLGMLRDKDCRTAFSAMRGRVKKLITTTVPDSPRRQSAKELAAAVEGICDDVTSCEDIYMAVDNAVKYACDNKNTMVLICGSLYLVSSLREYLVNNLE